MTDIRHTFVDGGVDGPDATKVRPSNWNETHVISGLVNGWNLLKHFTFAEWNAAVGNAYTFEDFPDLPDGTIIDDFGAVVSPDFDDSDVNNVAGFDEFNVSDGDVTLTTQGTTILFLVRDPDSVYAPSVGRMNSQRQTYPAESTPWGLPSVIFDGATAGKIFVQALQGMGDATAGFVEVYVMLTLPPA